MSACMFSTHSYVVLLHIWAQFNLVYTAVFVCDELCIQSYGNFRTIYDLNKFLFVIAFVYNPMEIVEQSTVSVIRVL